MKKRILKNIEWSIFICCILLLIIGLVALFSATQDNNYDDLKKQIIWAGISIPIMFVVVFIDYNTIAKFSPIFYGIFILLLIAVLFTPSINGAKSWFQITSTLTFQPSELAKVFVILFLSYVMVKIQERDPKEINRFTRLAIIFLVLGIPLGLIAIQPDIGTAVAFITATALMLFVSGIDRRYIIVAILLIVILIPVLYFFVLPDHAKK